MGRLFIRNLQKRRSFSALVANVHGMGRGTIAEGQCRVWKRPSWGKRTQETRTMGIVAADPKTPSTPTTPTKPTKPVDPPVGRTMGIAAEPPPVTPPVNDGGTKTMGIAVDPGTTGAGATSIGDLAKKS